ncbi:glycoside hydrolase family 88 protein [Coprobacter fastidiosus]|jgi:unsaturated chondroitin disaccharide hydrolase|uniref:glycoside hydrolase family 88 protein n=1 Tax=Coprobacter fastidiosus TaxID=1099853 RepID=UPI00266FB477|nr:glycoside hydrolase family 88 protein [Coprobacter fastidiosus]
MQILVLKKICVLVASLLLFANNTIAQKNSMSKIIDEAFKNASSQYAGLIKEMSSTPGLLPHSILPDGSLHRVSPSSWVSGFFPGSLWYIYEYTGNVTVRKNAEKFTTYLKTQKNNNKTHDIGFMLYCSYGNKWRLCGKDKETEDVLLSGAKALSSRFNVQVGCTQSWDTGKCGWSFPVIIDNMMNLELLMWAYKTSGDPVFKNIAVRHADTTLKNHFRKDNSSYHVVSYNPKTGAVEKKETHQGYSNESAWARGQAWGLYGYTMMYRETGNKSYLEMARKIASFIIRHKNLPKDKIPYWDFDAPNIPHAYRDVSAGAIICSALIELSDYVKADEADEYLAVAETQLRALASPAYTAKPGTNKFFILKHSVGYLPGNREIDVPLSYADYYYLEAMLRFKDKVLKK